MVDSRVSYLENELFNCQQDLTTCKAQLKQLQNFMLRQFGSVYVTFSRENDNERSANNKSFELKPSHVLTEKTANSISSERKRKRSDSTSSDASLKISSIRTISQKEHKHTTSSPKRKTSSSEGHVSRSQQRAKTVSFKKEMENSKRSSKTDQEKIQSEQEEDSSLSMDDEESSACALSNATDSEMIDRTSNSQRDNIRTSETDELRKHYEVLKDKSVRCKICYVVLKSGWHKFARHYKMHTGEKPFSCKYCGEKFARNDYVLNHIKAKHKTKKERKAESDLSEANVESELEEGCIIVEN